MSSWERIALADRRLWNGGKRGMRPRRVFRENLSFVRVTDKATACRTPTGGRGVHESEKENISAVNSRDYSHTRDLYRLNFSAKYTSDGNENKYALSDLSYEIRRGIFLVKYRFHVREAF